MPQDAELSPSCSVIICTRNRPAQLRRCLEALSCVTYPRFDVLIVDNAPVDKRSKGIAQQWGARYVVEPVAGLSRARNRGARHCEAEILAFLDDDAVPHPHWLNGLAREFQDPPVMAVAGQVVALSLETEAERLSAEIGGSEIGGAERKAVDQATPSWFELSNFGGIGIGANMAFRRKAFDVWPGFHERLDSGTILDGGGENHAFFSLIDRGYRVVYTPHAVVYHPLPRTMEYFRARYLRDFADSTAYLTLLLFEEPRYWRQLMKYMIEAMRGTQRRSRAQAVRPLPAEIFPLWRIVLAYLCGPLIYLWSRISNASYCGRDFDAWRIIDLHHLFRKDRSEEPH